MTDKKIIKTPTETVKLDEIWEKFTSEYMPFVEWMKVPNENYSFIIVKILETNPTPYKNKWSRDQFKIRVENVDQSQFILSAGKRLFIKLREYCLKLNKLPNELGFIQIDRIGDGFNTDYKILPYTFQKKIDG